MPRNTGRRVKDGKPRMAKNTGHGSRYAAWLDHEGKPVERDWKNDIQPGYAMIEDWGGYPASPKKSLLDRFFEWWG